MDDDYEEPPTFAFRAYLGLAMLAIFGWAWLAFNYPIVWGILTGSVGLIGLGLFTTKFVFNVEGIARTIGFTFVFGGCWFLIFWLIFSIVK